MKNKFTTVATLLGLELLESHDGGVFLSTDQMQIIEDHLLANPVGEQITLDAEEGVQETRVAAMEQSITELSERLSTAESGLSTANESITTLTGRLQIVEGEPGAAPLTPKTPKNEFDDSPVDAWDDPENPINKAIDADL